MRIVIDLQGAQTESRFRGIGRYSMSLTREMVKQRGNHEIVIALNGLLRDTIEPIRAEFEGLLPRENIRVWYAPGPVRECEPGNECRRQAAEFIREAFLASLNPDIIFVTSLFEGFVDDAVTSVGLFDQKTPVFATLYDLIPLLSPEHYLTPNPGYKKYYLNKIEHLKKATGWLCISNATEREALEIIGNDNKYTVNISTACDDKFCSLESSKKDFQVLTNRYRINKPFILYTGGSDFRKNLHSLIRAYSELSPKLRAEYHLVLAGKMPEGEIGLLKKTAKKAGLNENQVIFTGYVTDEMLLQLYNHCKLFVFPSWHEGFGLPVLEAMSCGAPTICSNNSSLPEVIGNEKALFNLSSEKEISDKIVQGLTDKSFRSELLKHSSRQKKKFSWEKSALRALEFLENYYDKEAGNEKKIVFPESRPMLAYVSPLPPERTGIADYSAELVPFLAEYYEIVVVTPQARVDDTWVSRHCKIRDVSWLRHHDSELDRVIYQFGNSPFHQHMLSLVTEIPGTVVLHDFYMSGLMSWLEMNAGVEYAWTKSLYEAHGYGSVCARYRDAEGAKRKYPANFNVLQYAQGIIVHSDYSRQLAHQWYGDNNPDNYVVIPPLRTPAPLFDKNKAKRQLGFREDDFIVCSFGFLDATKLNHRLLECWLASSLSRDKHCYLIFVGENCCDGYGSGLLRSIRDSGLKKRIRITGFASAEEFCLYLMAADMAVQLRTLSRGETSAAVLDCLNYALPLIVNRNGSMAELDCETAWMLPDEFKDADLIEALETLRRDPQRRRVLGRCACETMHQNHAPVECARRYAEAIERFHRRAQVSKLSLIRAIAKKTEVASFSEPELIRFSKSIAASLPPSRPAKRLFLDVTGTCRNDLKTGIERVARALMIALLDAPPPGYRIEPVYLTEAGGAWHYRYARRYILDLLGCPSQALNDEIVEPQNGDIVLVLDLSGDVLIQAQKAGLFAAYRDNGVAVFSTVFDLLPDRMPEVFPPGSDNMHRQWLQAISSFDGAVCISRAVADEFAAWQKRAGFDWKNRRPYRIEWFHLGADFEHSAPSHGQPGNGQKILAHLKAHPSFLMVGTIEPRKGQLQTIEAFTQLWEDGIDVTLVIVGKEGWLDVPDNMRRNIPETVQRLRSHPELDNRLFWLSGISDEYLGKIYAASTCLIAASYGEGFGLPLIEAAQHKLPIIARDIPVLREVAGDHVYYFQGKEPDGLAGAVKQWLELYKTGAHPRSDDMPWLTWEQSAEQIKQILSNNPLLSKII
ncbi:glycosyltransferase involved in cell wall biosynthesis [Desulfosalsimonas propionicica]|uniref:Glycosyltransferase involved in cell wall biosynthesis n=1 Tax=Desulfosalsimonas propionicica TaxID=332175 RepID=A0A7W0C6F2_9BACT|nr:glycosyltransferase [Desulfosalsimonas propionicica]MBA2880006.1 glycosyltransferase involved in cell wall biosynthesis [Desulfosalsimonas propionicica]